MRRALLATALLLGAAACGTATTVDMREPRRIVGTENAVRVDAEVAGDEVRNGGHVPITYAITNSRRQAIAVADLIPETSYDPDSRTITVSIGSEVPGLSMVPRLIRIDPGEKKTFSTIARIAFALPPNTDAHRAEPLTGLRLKVNFLGDTSGGFEELIGIAERGVADPKLADALFPVWVERNEVVYTNAVPMRWKTGLPDDAEPTPRRRRP